MCCGFSLMSQCTYFLMEDVHHGALLSPLQQTLTQHQCDERHDEHTQVRGKETHGVPRVVQLQSIRRTDEIISLYVVFFNMFIMHPLILHCSVSCCLHVCTHALYAVVSSVLSSVFKCSTMVLKEQCFISLCTAPKKFNWLKMTIKAS